VISPTQRPLSEFTQHSQQTDVSAPGRIRTLIPVSEWPLGSGLVELSAWFSPEYKQVFQCCKSFLVGRCVLLFDQLGLPCNFLIFICCLRLPVSGQVRTFCARVTWHHHVTLTLQELRIRLYHQYYHHHRYRYYRHLITITNYHYYIHTITK
jgi:hypothetical protein